MQTKRIYATHQSNLDATDNVLAYEGLGGHFTLIVDPKLLPFPADQLDSDWSNRLLPLFRQLVALLYGGPTEDETTFYWTARNHEIRYHMLPPGKAYWMHPSLWESPILRKAIQDVMEGRAEQLTEQVLHQAQEQKLRG